jgi:hypothetical protein
VSFRWKAHPVTLRSTVRTVVTSHETQIGLLPRLGWVFLARRLRLANQAMLDDLARAVGQGATTPMTRAAG